MATTAKLFGLFKAFAMRGNVLDMAVGIIIGAAFGRIITSLVSDIIMPPIGLVLGHVDFSSLFLNISGTTYPTLAAAKAANAATINYGTFHQHGDRFSDCRFRDFPDGAADQQMETSRRRLPRPPRRIAPIASRRFR